MKVNYESREVRVNGLSAETKNKISLIAKNLGVTRNEFLKVKIGEIVANTPPILLRQQED